MTTTPVESERNVAVCFVGLPDGGQTNDAVTGDDVVGFIENELMNSRIVGLAGQVIPANIVERINAADELAALGMELWLDQATAFTCVEAETLARFLRCHDNTEGADAFLEAHNAGDDEEDQHFIDHTDGATE
jgi:hypothetical protein